MGGKKSAKQFFQKHTNSANKKCWEKIVVIKCENRFLYSHECRDQKIWGKKHAKQFLQKRRKCASKKCWKKSTEKSAKKRFL